MEQRDEKPVITPQEEVSVSTTNPVMINAAKRNGQVHLNASGDNRSVMMLQQPQLVSVNAGTTQPPVINTGIDSSASSRSMHSTGVSTSVADYVIPGASMLPSGSNFVHVPMMSHQETAETEIDGSYDEPVRDKDELREQDRFLPIANVSRIMKKAIPETGKIAKDAKECVQECVSEFISFITSEASERCQQEKRKTINGEDILFAMTTLGFDNYIEPLKVYLTKYRETIKGDKILNATEYNGMEVEDGTNHMQHTIQYQVAGNTLHPSMVSSDGTFAYTQAQVSQLPQGMHFST